MTADHGLLALRVKERRNPSRQHPTDPRGTKEPASDKAMTGPLA